MFHPTNLPDNLTTHPSLIIVALLHGPREPRRRKSRHPPIRGRPPTPESLPTDLLHCKLNPELLFPLNLHPLLQYLRPLSPFICFSFLFPCLPGSRPADTNQSPTTLDSRLRTGYSHTVFHDTGVVDLVTGHMSSTSYTTHSLRFLRLPTSSTVVPPVVREGGEDDDDNPLLSS